LGLVHLGALLQATSHAMDGALAWLWLGRKGAVTAAVSLLAKTGPVAAIPVLGAVVQASADVTSVTRPTGVAVAFALNTLSVSTAALSMTRASASAISSTPSVFTRADSVEALSVT